MKDGDTERNQRVAKRMLYAQEHGGNGSWNAKCRGWDYPDGTFEPAGDPEWNAARHGWDMPDGTFEPSRSPRPLTQWQRILRAMEDAGFWFAFGYVLIALGVFLMSVLMITGKP